MAWSRRSSPAVPPRGDRPGRCGADADQRLHECVQCACEPQPRRGRGRGTGLSARAFLQRLPGQGQRVQRARWACGSTTAAGPDLGVVQIAGLVARRIRCDAKLGDRSAPGRGYGLIRFGSRVDVYLPAGVAALVAVGQTMVAGETVLADLASAAERRGRNGEDIDGRPPYAPPAGQPAAGSVGQSADPEHPDHARRFAPA